MIFLLHKYQAKFAISSPWDNIHDSFDIIITINFYVFKKKIVFQSVINIYYCFIPIRR